MESKLTTFDPESTVSKKEKYSGAKDLTIQNEINNDYPKLLEESIKVDPTVNGENALTLKRTYEQRLAICKTEYSFDGKAVMIEENNTCDNNERQSDSPGGGKSSIKDPTAGTKIASVPIFIFCPKPPTKPGLFDCNKCSKNYESQAVLDSHKISQHVKKPYDPKHPIVCDICDQHFKLFPHLVSHRNSKHRMLNPLYQSTTSFINQGVGNENSKKVATVSTTGSGGNEKLGFPPDPVKGPFSCSQCPRTFAREKGLNSHFQYTHIDKIPEGPRPFVCDICNKSFLMGLALGTHRKAVHGKFRRK